MKRLAVLLCLGMLSSMPAAASPAHAFVALGDFTVNVPHTARRSSYVVVSLSANVATPFAERFQALLPRIKGMVFQELYRMAQAGHLTHNPQIHDIQTATHAVLDRLQLEGVQEVVVLKLLRS